MSNVDHPAHYGGADNPFEVIKVIESWCLGFKLGSALKYLARAGRKPGEEAWRDLRKAIWYMRRHLEHRDPVTMQRDYASEWLRGREWMDSDDTIEAWGISPHDPRRPAGANPVGACVRAICYWQNHDGDDLLLMAVNALEDMCNANGYPRG